MAVAKERVTINGKAEELPAGLTITEVPSVERRRIYGQSNLHAVSDGLRVLRTLRTERARVRRNTALDNALLDQSPPAE